MRDAPELDEFGALLRHYRLAARLTQEVLAERAGLAVRSIPGLEAGEHRPQRETLRRLAEALGLAAEQRDHLQALAGRVANSHGLPSAERRAGDAYGKARHPPHNLPVQLTSFVGRRQELADVARLVDPPSGSVTFPPRLVTLTGSGGCGKTRLALQVAEHVLDLYPGGAWFVDLAPLADHNLVPQTVCVTLDAGASPGSSPLAALIDHLRSRHSLLILDNCEHLLDACARLADALLRGCPRLYILATSREPLGIAGEVSCRVASLAMPEAGHLPPVASLRDYDAIRLFTERVLAVQSEFALTDGNAPAVAQICHRLDGIPLALELAAARVRVLSPEQVAARLDNRFQLLTGGSRMAPPRQQTLRAMVAWSYDLLTERERCLFDRLSVFAGGWTIDSAEAVCAGDGVAASEVLDLLTRLVDQSLVVATTTREGTGRYRLLETLRQFGRERLEARGGSEIVLRDHAAFFLGLAERAEPQAADLGSLNNLGADLDNIRAALHWHFDHGAVEDGLRLAAALGELWSHLGHPGEGYAWLRTFLELPREGATGKTRAKAQCWAGALGLMVGDATVGHALLVDSLSYGRAARDDAIRGEAAVRLGLLTHSRGNYAAACELFEESLAARRRSGTPEQAIRSLHFLCLAMVCQGEHLAAQPLLETGLAEARAIGYRNWAAALLGNLGLVAQAQGDHATARKRFEASLQLFEDSMDWPEATAVQNYLAGLDAHEGKFEAARAGYAASLALARPARFIFRIAESLDGLAVIAARQHQPERALRIAGGCAALRQVAGYQARPYANAELEQALAESRGAVGNAAAAEAWAAGQAMSLDQTVDEAL